VWHASVAPCGLKVGKNLLRRVAFSELKGVGAAMAGQWEEYSGYAFHLRRRLSEEEQLKTGQAIDLRCTGEALERFERIKDLLPPMALHLAMQELS
jgi:hypothetical protein